MLNNPGDKRLEKCISNALGAAKKVPEGISLVNITNIQPNEVEFGKKAVAKWFCPLAKKARIAAKMTAVAKEGLKIVKKAGKVVSLAFILAEGARRYQYKIDAGCNHNEALYYAEIGMSNAVVNDLFMLDVQEPIWNAAWNEIDKRVSPYLYELEMANHLIEEHGGGEICECFGVKYE